MQETPVMGKKRVRFQLEAAPDNEVYVVGTFNGWDPKKNKLIYKDGVYARTLLIEKGRHEYKFVVGGEWREDPGCREQVRNEHGSLNSVITVD